MILIPRTGHPVVHGCDLIPRSGRGVGVRERGRRSPRACRRVGGTVLGDTSAEAGNVQLG